MGLTVHELHRNVVNLFAVAARGMSAPDLVDRHDVRMAQSGCRLCFLNEPAKPVSVGDQLRRKDFKRDSALEPLIMSLVDVAHATGANMPQDPVLAERGSCLQRLTQFRWNRSRPGRLQVEL